MNNGDFDEGFFAQRAEGNLSFRPDSFLQSPVVKRSGDSWVKPFVNRLSIIPKPMRSMSCGPVTLNSFSAFADATNFDPANPADQASLQVVQPAAVSGSSWLDTISGVVKDFAPVASAAVQGQPAPATSTQSKQILKQYLQGKLPDMTLNDKGQVVSKSSLANSSLGTIGPIIGLGIAGVVLMMVLNRGGKK